MLPYTLRSPYLNRCYGLCANMHTQLALPFQFRTVPATLRWRRGGPNPQFPPLARLLTGKLTLDWPSLRMGPTTSSVLAAEPTLTKRCQ